MLFWGRAWAFFRLLEREYFIDLHEVLRRLLVHVDGVQRLVNHAHCQQFGKYKSGA